MKLSARNVLTGVVKSVTSGPVDSEVVVEIAAGCNVVAVITQKSVDSLKLKPGSKVYAIIKASNVMIGAD